MYNENLCLVRSFLKIKPSFNKYDATLETVGLSKDPPNEGCILAFCSLGPIVRPSAGIRDVGELLGSRL